MKYFLELNWQLQELSVSSMGVKNHVVVHGICPMTIIHQHIVKIVVLVMTPIGMKALNGKYCQQSVDFSTGCQDGLFGTRGEG